MKYFFPKIFSNYSKFFGKKSKNLEVRGFTLIESLVSTAVFLVIALSVYNSYVGLLNVVRASRIKIAATSLANERFEIVRNMPYASVGLVAGIPVGIVPRFQTFARDGINFQATTSIQNMDDPFDGTIGGAPNDLSPADYKLIEMEIGCASCKNFTPLTFTARVSPKNLEAASTNGSLFVQVLDANGNGVSGARVQIINNALIPVINIDDTVGANGMYQLVDAPPSIDSYHIIVTKNGYSTEQSYPPGDAANPNPAKRDSTVALQQLTQISFAIDVTGTVKVSSVLPNCAPVSSVAFNILGAKIIGTDNGVPPAAIYKYTQSFTTNGSGEKTLSSMEWDTYNLDLNDLNYDLAGTVSQLPISLAPGTIANATLVMAPKNPKSLLLTIKDAATGLPVTGASVRLTNGGSYDETLITGRGYLSQTEWIGGGGQDDFTDQTKYFSQNGNIEENLPSGELRLKQPFSPGPFETSGELISSTFDTGSGSNFYQLLWQPITQPVDTGIPNVRFQLATNDDNLTWNFIGPDGTNGSFYDTTNQNINSIHNTDRYLRYKVFLDTALNVSTPSVSDVSFTYTSSCVPPGQVLFSGLSTDDYDFEVTHNLYQTNNGSFPVGLNWQNQDITLQPL